MAVGANQGTEKGNRREKKYGDVEKPGKNL